MNKKDSNFESRDDQFIDVDRMVSEGLGGGEVTINNGLIDEYPDFTEEDPPTHNGKR